MKANLFACASQGLGSQDERTSAVAAQGFQSMLGQSLGKASSARSAESQNAPGDADNTDGKQRSPGKSAQDLATLLAFFSGIGTGSEKMLLFQNINNLMGNF